MKKMLSLSLLALSLIYGCSSQPELRVEDNSDTIKRDYEVANASSNIKPQWIEDATVWAEQNNEDIAKFRYFSFETTAKVDRQAACSVAKTQARSDIAAEIATFIEKTLGESQSGQASIDENNPNAQPLREFMETTLAEKTQAMLNGAQVYKTYWEKRHYKKELGAKKDFTGFVCAALVKMESQRLREAVEKAAQLVVKKADDPETKENVKKALENVSDNFVKARQGVI